MVKIALNATPMMNTRRNARCALSNSFVSKMERRISPSPPIKEPTMARMPSTVSRRRIWATRLWEHNMRKGISRMVYIVVQVWLTAPYV